MEVFGKNNGIFLFVQIWKMSSSTINLLQVCGYGGGHGGGHGGNGGGNNNNGGGGGILGFLGNIFG